MNLCPTSNSKYLQKGFENETNTISKHESYIVACVERETAPMCFKSITFTKSVAPYLIEM